MSKHMKGCSENTDKLMLYAMINVLEVTGYTTTATEFGLETFHFIPVAYLTV